MLGRRGGPMTLARPRQEADDTAAAHLVENDAVGDLVQPGSGFGTIRKGALGLVGLDESVLGEVGGNVGVAHHPVDVRIDLAVVEGKELLDESPVAGTFRRHAHATLQMPCLLYTSPSPRD